MAKLIWGPPDGYGSGLDRGVFYPKGKPGEAWNGLTTVKESSNGFEEQTRYIDGVKTNYRRKIGYFSGTIEAFTYPDSFYENVLLQKRAKSFGLSYRVSSIDGYKIHLVYNVLVDPSESFHQPDEVDLFSWNFETNPVSIPGGINSAHIVIDTSIAYASVVAQLEGILYGSNSSTPRLPDPAEIFNMFEENSILKVVDHGDGTFTVTGPDSAIQMLDATTFQIDWPSAVYVDAVSYTISSL